MGVDGAIFNLINMIKLKIKSSIKYSCFARVLAVQGDNVSLACQVDTLAEVRWLVDDTLIDMEATHRCVSMVDQILSS